MKKNCACGVDWDLAGQVQQLLLPKSSPVCGWCCIGVRNVMATTIGGDYFDFIALPDGCQSLFVGDVTGHGTHASLVMSLLYGYIHHLSEGDECDPRLAVQRINAFLQHFAHRSVEYDHFFSSTLFYGIIDPDTLTMRYVNAGHVAPLVRRGDQVVYLGTTTAPVGFFDQPEVEVQSFRFRRGDRLLLYTDGVTDLQNPAGEFFGLARLEQLLLTSSAEHLSFLDQVMAEVATFAEGSEPLDDCTAIVVDFHPQGMRSDQ